MAIAIRPSTSAFSGVASSKFAALWSPSGVSQQLFSVPAFNYGWQPHYLLDKPVSVSAGSTLRVAGALDNSVSNPTNPDPDLEIPFGFNSWEEMFTGYFTYYQSFD